MSDYGLGRLHLPDVRDHAFLMDAALEPERDTPLPPYCYYTPGRVLNQGTSPECVAYAWRQWLTTGTTINRGGQDADALYQRFQTIDRLPMPHDGTTVRAGAQTLQTDGYIPSYVWAFSADPVRRWILAGKGPVVVGTRWDRTMFAPDAKGYVHPGGDVAGGHAYLLIGANDRYQAFRAVNSWSTAWGQRGRFWISYADMDALIRDNGEACTAYEVRR